MFADPGPMSAASLAFPAAGYRHTTGVNLRTVQDLMGHKRIAITVRYAHLSPAHKLDAVERLVRETSDTRTDTRDTAESMTEKAVAQVSGKKTEKEWRWVDSNHRPRDYEALALTT